MKETYSQEEVIKLIMLFSSDCTTWEELVELMKIEDNHSDTLESFEEEVKQFLKKKQS